MYPEYAEINGKEYKIDTDFNTALRCFEIIDDKTINDYERALAIIYLLFDFVPENDEDIKIFLEKAKTFLQCGKDIKTQRSQKKDMDFEQDRGLINSSFMSDYHIDLSKEKLHFWQFIELIEGLTENSALNRVRELRNYDLSEIKDAKQKDKIKKAQKDVALKNTSNKSLTAEEEDNINDFLKMINKN